MKYANLFWWIGYAILAIMAQIIIPGVDFFLPGFIVAMQERKAKQFAWVALSFLILQEGMGTMAFGAVFLWYLTIIIFYIAGQWLFEVESLSFILLLSVVLSITHYMVIVSLAGLQGMQINLQSLIDESVYQAFVTPFLWHFAHYTRRGLRYAA